MDGMVAVASKRAVEWLAAAAFDPRECKRAWEHGENGTVLLAAGRFWDVLILPEDLGLLALDILLCIPQCEPGPTLADFGARRIGFFLPPDPSSRWIGTGIRYAGKGAWIVVPAPARGSGAIQWLVPPDGSGVLYSAGALELAIHEAAAELARQLVG